MTDIRRSRMIVEEEAYLALAEFGGTSCKNARMAIEKAIWRALSREQSYRIDEGWKQPTLQTMGGNTAFGHDN